MITQANVAQAIANHPLTRLLFWHDTERYIFSEYFVTMQNKSETLLSLSTMIEHWRTTSYDVLFEEMRQ